MLYIRADANNIIATGHMMRCFAIAEMVESFGDKAVFLTADESGQEMVENKGYECINIKSQWNNIEAEINILCNLIYKYEIKQLLIDTYYVTQMYLNEISKITKVIYIDDLNQFTYPCQVIVNYSIFSEKLYYKKHERNEKLLLGCQYAPLRKNFWNLGSKVIHKQVKRILLLSGGSDPYHFAITFMEYIIKHKLYIDVLIDVVCGSYSRDYAKLQKLAQNNINVNIHKNIANLEYYMQQADIAISAGGMTLYELCACGTPTICYIMADNQKENVSGFEKAKIMQSCGDIRDNQYMRILLECIDNWMFHEEERKEVSIAMQKLIDGTGAKRILEQIISVS